jgi:hypothetical protein
LVLFCFKYDHSKGDFSCAKIPVGECGERNINREIGFKGSNHLERQSITMTKKIVIHFQQQVLKSKGCPGQYHLLR